MSSAVRFSVIPTVRSADTAGRVEGPAAGGPLNLNDLLVKHPTATYFLRASGHEMAGAGIADGDLLVVDRAMEPADGRIVIVTLDEAFAVRRLRRRAGRWILETEPATGAPHPVTEYTGEVWGVVTASVKLHGTGDAR